MAAALVQEKEADTGGNTALSVAVALAAPLTVGNAAVAYMASVGKGRRIHSVTDEGGNVWVALEQSGVSGAGNICAFWCQNITAAASTVTITQDGSAVKLIGVVQEYSGIDPAAPVAGQDSFDDTAATQAHSTPQITPSAPSLVLAAIGFANASGDPFASPAGWTESLVEASVGGMAIGIAYQELDVPTAIGDTFTASSGTSTASLIIAALPLASSGPVPVTGSGSSVSASVGAAQGKRGVSGEAYSQSASSLSAAGVVPAAPVSARQRVSWQTDVAYESIGLTWAKDTLDGSLLILILAYGGAEPDGISPPLGWVQVPDPEGVAQGSAGGVGAWYRQYAASVPAGEAGATVINWNGATWAAAVMLEYSDMTAANVLEVCYPYKGVSTQPRAGGSYAKPRKAGTLCLGILESAHNYPQTMLPDSAWVEAAHALSPGADSSVKVSLGVYESRLIQGDEQARVAATIPQAKDWHSLMLIFDQLPDASEVPAYSLDAQWEAANTGLFIIGSSAIGGGDVLGEGYGSGAYSTLPAKQVSVKRGRQDPTTPIQAGEADFNVTDSDGTYNPNNAASPLYGSLDGMRPMRLHASYDGISYDLFNGFLVNLYDDPSVQNQQATGVARDMFEWLTNSYPVITDPGATSTGQAIALILEAIHWPAAQQNLAVGDSIPGFSQADGSQDALTLIGNLLTAEQGVAFVSAGGVFSYQDRHASAVAVSMGVISDVAQGILPGIDVATVRNRAQVTRDGGAQQTAVADGSASRYGYRDVPPISTPYLNSDTQALQLGQWLVANRSTPKAPVWSVTLIRGRDAARTQMMLARDVGDVITLKDSHGGTYGDFVIEGVNHQVQAGGTDHQVVWTLSQRRSGVFVIGRSTIGGGDFISY